MSSTTPACAVASELIRTPPLVLVGSICRPLSRLSESVWSRPLSTWTSVARILARSMPCAADPADSLPSRSPYALSPAVPTDLNLRIVPSTLACAMKALGPRTKTPTRMFLSAADSGLLTIIRRGRQPAPGLHGTAVGGRHDARSATQATGSLGSAKLPLGRPKYACWLPGPLA